jgi:hypothetical protein
MTSTRHDGSFDEFAVDERRPGADEGDQVRAVDRTPAILLRDRLLFRSPHGANLTDDIDLVVTHQDLTPRAKDRTPSAQHVSVDNFMSSPKYDAIVEELKRTNAPHDSSAPS